MALINYTKRVLTENLALKTTALALSFLMWITITNDQPVEKVLSVRLEYRNIPDGMEISSQQIGSVDLYVRMPGRRTSISESDFVAFVDLKDATPGQKISHLDPQKNVSAPNGVEVLKLSPPRITLFLERTVQVLVPIEPTLDGGPANGYEVVNVPVVPTKIYISGPESHVKRVTSARTETVSISNKSMPVTAWVNINVEDSTIRIMDTKPVQVTVEIRERRRDVLVEGVPIQVIPEGSPVRVRPKNLKLRVSVPLSSTQPIRPDLFLATAEVGGVDGAGGRKTVAPTVEINKSAPQDMKIVSVLPPTVEVSYAGRPKRRTTR